MIKSYSASVVVFGHSVPVILEVKFLIFDPVAYINVPKFNTVNKVWVR